MYEVVPRFHRSLGGSGRGARRRVQLGGARHVRVIDSIVSHAVKDFKDGCSHYISHDVLFEVGHYGECGWDNWSPCSGSSEYFVPFMVCKVPSDEWP